jgi:nucleoside permease NupC
MRYVIAAAFLVLSAGAVLASDVTPYDKELANQMLFPKKDTAQKAESTQAVAVACSCKR